MVGGSLIAGSMASKSAAKQSQTQNQYTKEDQELNFQRQAWLAQQQRLWQLQDRKYKQQAIAGFKGNWDKGGDITPPNQDAEMNSLDKFDPNKLGSIGTQQTAQPTAPLQQLAPGGATLGQTPNRLRTPDQVQ